MSRKFHKIRPVGDQILVLHDRHKQTTGGGILLPDKAAIPVLTGRILAMSEKIKSETYEFPFEVGDQIVYNVSAAIPIDLDPGDKRYLLPAEAVLGVIEEAGESQYD